MTGYDSIITVEMELLRRFLARKQDKLHFKWNFAKEKRGGLRAMKETKSSGTNPIAEKIRFLRKSRGLKQIQLAEIVGVGASAISNYEKGVSQPEKRVLIKMAEYFEVTIDYLLDRDAVHEPPMPAPRPLLPVFSSLVETCDGIAAMVPLPHIIDIKEFRNIVAWLVDSDCVKLSKVEKGDVVFVNRRKMPKEGELAVGIYENKKTVIGRFHKANDDLFLLCPHSTDPRFKPVCGAPGKLKLLGVAVGANVHL